MEKKLKERMEELTSELVKQRDEVERQREELYAKEKRLMDKIEYNIAERKRLEEVIREQAEEIRILLEGGSGFRKIKENMGSLHEELNNMEKNMVEHQKGADFVRSIMGNIDEIFRNRA